MRKGGVLIRGGKLRLVAIFLSGMIFSLWVVGHPKVFAISIGKLLTRGTGNNLTVLAKDAKATSIVGVQNVTLELWNAQGKIGEATSRSDGEKKGEMYFTGLSAGEYSLIAPAGGDYSIIRTSYAPSSTFTVPVNGRQSDSLRRIVVAVTPKSTTPPPPNTQVALTVSGNVADNKTQGNVKDILVCLFKGSTTEPLSLPTGHCPWGALAEDTTTDPKSNGYKSYTLSPSSPVDPGNYSVSTYDKSNPTRYQKGGINLEVAAGQTSPANLRARTIFLTPLAPTTPENKYGVAIQTRPSGEVKVDQDISVIATATDQETGKAKAITESDYRLRIEYSLNGGKRVVLDEKGGVSRISVFTAAKKGKTEYIASVVQIDGGNNVIATKATASSQINTPKVPPVVSPAVAPGKSTLTINIYTLQEFQSHRRLKAVGVKESIVIKVIDGAEKLAGGIISRASGGAVNGNEIMKHFSIDIPSLFEEYGRVVFFSDQDERDKYLNQQAENGDHKLKAEDIKKICDSQTANICYQKGSVHSPFKNMALDSARTYYPVFAHNNGDNSWVLKRVVPFTRGQNRQGTQTQNVITVPGTLEVPTIIDDFSAKSESQLPEWLVLPLSIKKPAN